MNARRIPFYKPNTVQFELVQGCNRQCFFCGSNGFERKLHFIEKSVLTKECDLVRESGYNPRILIAGHGENALHPQFHKCLRLMRRLMPKQHLQIMTNGYRVQKYGLGEIVEMFDSGLNDISLDEYADSKFDDDEIKDVLSSYESESGHLVKFARMEKGVPLYANKNPKSKRLLIIPAIEEDEVCVSRKLTNHCGAGMPPSDRLSDRVCTRIFRELSFRWDGNVAICCQDFRGQYPIANAMDASTFDELWLHERFEAARRILYHKKRTFFPCSICDHLPIREGLLPDHLGKEIMPKPRRSDFEIVTREYEPLAKIVLREWEKDDK